MNRKGFALFEIVIVLGIIVFLVGGGLYFNSTQNQKNTVQIGNDALEKAKELQQQSQSRANQEGNAIDRFNGNSSVSISSTQPSVGTKSLTGPSSSLSRGNNCQTPVFTKYLVAPDRVSDISPLGTPNRPNRSYVSLTKDLQDSVSKVSLYAPSDVRLVGVSFYIHPLLKIPLWGLSFDAGCGVTFLLGHVMDVVDKIKIVGPSELATGATRSAMNELKVPVSFKAGELIGSVSIVHSPEEALQLAADNSLSFDFVAQNQAHTNQFANQTRYQRSDFLHSICPYDLFSPEIRSGYAAKYGGTHDPFAGATCGYVSHDVQGTISGQWYVNQDPVSGVGTGDNLGVNFTSFAEGVNGYARLLVDEGSNDTIHTYSNNPTYIDPATVRDSHCYQNDNASYYVYARLASSEVIDIASGVGACPGSFPNSGYKTFYR